MLNLRLQVCNLNDGLCSEVSSFDSLVFLFSLSFVHVYRPAGLARVALGSRSR